VSGRRTLSLACTLLFLLAVAAWGDDLYRLLSQREAVQSWLADFGLWGPLVSILLNVAQVLLAPVPGHVLGWANGYLYGVALGTLYSLIGVTAGSALAMGLARRLGRPLVMRLVEPERLARWEGIARRQGPAFFFLVFLLPFLPDDLICFVVGLTPLSIPRMLALCALGRLPGLAAACWVGANLTALPWWGWGVLVVGGVALAALLYRFQARLEAALLWRGETGPQTRREPEVPPPGLLPYPRLSSKEEKKRYCP